MEAGMHKREQRVLIPAQVKIGVRVSLVAIACALASACGVLTTAPQAPVEQPVLSEIPPVNVRRLALPPEAISSAPANTEPLAPVAVVLSSDIFAYSGVAERLFELLDDQPIALFTLDANTGAADPYEAAMAAEINALEPRATVAIGLPAALFASRSVESPVVFCQVFNYAEYPELANAVAAVSVLPSFERQLHFWKGVDSSLTSVGAIFGPGHEALLTDSRRAAESEGLEFEHRVSQSDQETVYLFKRLAADIDGFWLVPDNRILSLSAINEVMEYAAEHEIPVVVSVPELLQFGALMSLAPSPAQVADTVFEVLRSLLFSAASSFMLVAPDSFEVEFNPIVAARFGLGVD